MADQNKDLRTRAQLLDDTIGRQERINAMIQRGAVSQELLNRFTVIQQEKIKEAAPLLKKLNEERLRGAAAAEAENKNLGSLYKNLSKFETERIANTQKSNSLTQDQVGKVDKLAEINRDIAKLAVEDVHKREELLTQYNDIQKTNYINYLLV